MKIIYMSNYCIIIVRLNGSTGLVLNEGVSEISTFNIFICSTQSDVLGWPESVY